MNRGPQEIATREECVPNIGARGRRRRTWLGALWSLATALLVGALLLRGASVAAFLMVAPFAMICALYFFQVKEKT